MVSLADAGLGDVAPVVVIGSSAAGLVLAASLSGNGFPTTLIEPDPSAAERAATFLRRMNADSEGAVSVTHNWAALKQAGLVVEALSDSPELIDEACTSLQDLLSPSVAIATTSDIVQRRLAQAIPDGQSLVGLTLAQPAQTRALLEILPRPNTTPHALATIEAVAERLGKSTIIGVAGHSSPSSRLLMRLHEAGDMMLMDGAVPHDIDAAMIAFGYDLGLYEAQDWIGLTAAYAERKTQGGLRDPARRFIPISDRMVEEGRLGRLVGVGWYRYPGGGGAVIDPIVEDLIREEAWFAEVEPRLSDTADIQDRLHLALVQEGLMMLAEGALRTAAEVDHVAVAGLGFPAKKGGPMALCDQMG